MRFFSKKILKVLKMFKFIYHAPVVVKFDKNYV
jgi:hypothetical protein